MLPITANSNQDVFDKCNISAIVIIDIDLFCNMNVDWLDSTQKRSLTEKKIVFKLK